MVIKSNVYETLLYYFDSIDAIRQLVSLVLTQWYITSTNYFSFPPIILIKVLIPTNPTTVRLIQSYIAFYNKYTEPSSVNSHIVIRLITNASPHPLPVGIVGWSADNVFAFGAYVTGLTNLYSILNISTSLQLSSFVFNTSCAKEVKLTISILVGATNFKYLLYFISKSLLVTCKILIYIK